MKVLYCSSLVSDSLFDSIFQNGQTRDYTGQKYHGLFVKGLSGNLSPGDITALSHPPCRNFIFRCKEYVDGVEYRYVPIIPVFMLKQLFSFVYSFWYTLYWCIKYVGEQKVIFSSMMRVYQYPAIWLGSCLFKRKSISVVCDIPWMTILQVSATKPSLKQRLSIWLSRKIGAYFDGYVFLTESMNGVINKKNKPYIVVEGFCDSEMAYYDNSLTNKYKEKVILYAGGLHERYGIGRLVDAIKQIDDPNVVLLLFGSGDMNDRLTQEKDERIRFLGPVSNRQVVESEIKATLLINPRPTTDEYTMYSFPSKTLEYMASGTYTLTTRLSGIPDEYYTYCGVIESFDIDGIAKAIKKTLSMSKDELYARGLKAKQFVLEKKNNLSQTRRVIDFVKTI